MRQRQLSIVKITRPKITGVYERKRLFKLLDRCLHKPVTWISGPAGSGRTTLVGSYLDSRKLPCLWYQIDQGDSDIATFFYYLGLAGKKAAPRYKKALPLLTPEYLMGLPTFTKRWFENLFSRLKPPYIVVFDNYQDVAPDSGLHDVLRDGVSVIPDGIEVIVISRGEPPPAFARLGVSDRMAVVGWEDVRFTLAESKALVRARERLPDETVRKLHDATGGWAAGLVLMMNRAEIRPESVHAASEFPPEQVFGYFAEEVLDKLDSATRDFLLVASFLPIMTSHTAGKLTDNDDAGKILSRLCRNHFFTERNAAGEAVYQFHPLFREFLLTRVKESLSREGILRVQKRAAALLMEAGWIEDAIGLFIEGRDWDGVERTLLGPAAELVSQGRSKTLEEWINAIPVELRDNNPWLIYWLGICALPYDPAKSRRLSERAFMLFDRRNDDAGALLSWAAAIQSAFHEWDDFDKINPLIQWIDKRMESKAAFPSPEIEALVATGMTGALLWKRRSYSEFKKWTDRALTLTRTAGDCNLRLLAGINAAQFYILTGDFASGRELGEALARAAQAPGVSPLMRVLCKAIDSFVQIMTMSSEEPLKSVLEGLEVAEKSGIHMWDHMLFAQGVCVSLNTGDLEAAALYLGNMKASLVGPKSFGLFHYHMLSGWYFLLNEELNTAQAHAENALKYILDSKAFHPEALFSVHFELAQIFHDQAEHEKASDHMACVNDLVQTSGSSILEYMHLMSVAQFAFDKDEQQKGLESLQKAMSLGRQQNYMSMFWWWRPAVMSRLCAKALEQGIETDYVRTLIQKRGLVPQGSVDAWPWPLKMYTLGDFKLLRHDKQVKYSRKAPKKPLELLRVIIALGGRNLSEERLMDVLWPDAEGDSGRKALSVTLARLRELLGVKDALQMNEGMISLNDRIVWTDVWAFEKLLEDAESGRREENGERNARSERDAAPLEKVIGMYKGHFLAAEPEPWAMHLRERLRDKFMKSIDALGPILESSQEYKKAIQAYQRGLETDDLAETYYQRMMRCYQRLGRRAEALAVYNRCKKTLAAYGVEPTAETEAIHKELISR